LPGGLTGKVFETVNLIARSSREHGSSIV
jgi:hypothetical protein